MESQISQFLRGISKGPFRVLRDDNGKDLKKQVAGEDGDLYACAVEQAWLDLYRTVPGAGKNASYGQMRANFADMLANFFDFDGAAPADEDAFDAWFQSACGSIMESTDLTVGQAQKLINMAFKYLYCCIGRLEQAKPWFAYCHMPLDSYTLQWYKSTKRSPKLYHGEKWSQMNDLKQYFAIQTDIRTYLGNKHVLSEEFAIWQREKRKDQLRQTRADTNRIRKSADCPPELQKQLEAFSRTLTAQLKALE
ncbi:MAG: hypothetical protein IIY79_04620 [Ruminococcus sp.]|nr:hypothetical protein [Ruminococcus sp.]